MLSLLQRRSVQAVRPYVWRALTCKTCGDPIIHTKSSWTYPDLEAQNTLFGNGQGEPPHEPAPPPSEETEICYVAPRCDVKEDPRACKVPGNPLIHTETSWTLPNLEEQNNLFPRPKTPP